MLILWLDEGRVVRWSDGGRHDRALMAGGTVLHLPASLLGWHNLVAAIRDACEYPPGHPGPYVERVTHGLDRQGAQGLGFGG